MLYVLGQHFWPPIERNAAVPKNGPIELLIAHFVWIKYRHKNAIIPSREFAKGRCGRVVGLPETVLVWSVRWPRMLMVWNAGDTH